MFVVLFWRLGASSFWDPDEAHYAETTRELLVTGDWWAPYYNEQPFFDKPIFFHQLQAAAMLVAGRNELGARLVPALAALALVLFTGWLGARLISVNAGLLAALLLAANPGVFGLTRYAVLDTLFTALLFGGVGLLAIAALDPPHVGSGPLTAVASAKAVSRITTPARRSGAWLQWLGYLLIAGAVMTKGPLALVLCGLAMGLAIAVSADVRRRLLGLHWIAGLGLAVAISAPWFVYMYLRFRGDFVAGYVLDENIRLYATERFGNQPPFWFYFQIIATGMLPWTGIVIGRFVDDVRAAMSHRRDEAPARPDGVDVMLWAWTIAIVGFFTFSRFKLDHYVFPAAPALCLLIARAWADLRAFPDSPEHRGARIGVRLVGPLLILMGAAAGYFLLSQLALPPATLIVPAAVVAGGLVITVRGNVRPPEVPWIALTAVATIYGGVLLFVMPALEKQKVIPDIARWVASRMGPDTRIASYQLNRWNTAFRFYVDRHVTMFDEPEDMVEFVRSEEPGDPRPYYAVMLGEGYDELVARGVPLQIVYAREGMWATSGRALWRQSVPATRFVVVTSTDGTVR